MNFKRLDINLFKFKFIYLNLFKLIFYYFVCHSYVIGMCSYVTCTSFVCHSLVEAVDLLWLQCSFVKFFSNLRIFQLKVQKLEQPSNQNHSQHVSNFFTTNDIENDDLKVSNALYSLILFSMLFVCHLYALACHSYVNFFRNYCAFILLFF